MIQFDGKEYYTIGECADIIGVSERSVYKYVKLGTLPAYKVGRRWYVTKENLDRYITGTPCTPAAPAADTEQ
jgi:excisionase family DNA binding protein